MKDLLIKIAIAPTASISIIAGNSSLELNHILLSYTQKTLSGSFGMQNKNLVKLLNQKEKTLKSVVIKS